MVVMEGTKCDSRYPSVAVLDSDRMIVVSEGYAGVSGDNKHATKDPTVKRKGYIVPSEDTKYAITVCAVSSEEYKVSSRDNKHSRTVS